MQGKNLTIDPSGEFKSEREIGDVVVTFSSTGAPVYLRDLFDISRGYESPARYLNFYDWKDAEGDWHRTRAITLSVQMRSGEIIGEFGKAVDEALAGMSRNCRKTSPGEDQRPAATGRRERRPVHGQPV